MPTDRAALESNVKTFEAMASVHLKAALRLKAEIEHHEFQARELTAKANVERLKLAAKLRESEERDPDAL